MGFAWKNGFVVLIYCAALARRKETSARITVVSKFCHKWNYSIGENQSRTRSWCFWMCCTDSITRHDNHMWKSLCGHCFTLQHDVKSRIEPWAAENQTLGSTNFITSADTPGSVSLWLTVLLLAMLPLEGASYTPIFPIIWRIHGTHCSITSWHSSIWNNILTLTTNKCSIRVSNTDAVMLIEGRVWSKSSDLVLDFSALFKIINRRTRATTSKCLHLKHVDWIIIIWRRRIQTKDT